jgi:hypothetical protein
VVKALGYKPAGRGFDIDKLLASSKTDVLATNDMEIKSFSTKKNSRWCHWYFSVT